PPHLPSFPTRRSSDLEPIRRLAADDGLAREGARPEPTPWQDPDVQWKPRRIELTFAKGADAGLRDDALQVYGDFDAFHVDATKRSEEHTSELQSPCNL